MTVVATQVTIGDILPKFELLTCIAHPLNTVFND